jgi:hypothetical protein
MECANTAVLVALCVRKNDSPQANIDERLSIGAAAEISRELCTRRSVMVSRVMGWRAHSYVVTQAAHRGRSPLSGENRKTFAHFETYRI